MKIDNIKSWLEKCNSACFSIQLPNGWLGRPYDNQHRLDSYTISQNEIDIKFDDGRELIIHNYSDIIFEVDSSNNHIVTFNTFSKIEFVWFPYDKSITEKTTQVFNEGELKLYGKYFK